MLEQDSNKSFARMAGILCLLDIRFPHQPFSVFHCKGIHDTLMTQLSYVMDPRVVFSRSPKERS